MGFNGHVGSAEELIVGSHSGVVRPALHNIQFQIGSIVFAPGTMVQLGHNAPEKSIQLSNGKRNVDDNGI